MTKERMQLLRQIQSYLIRKIFIKKQLALEKTLMLVAQENSKLIPGGFTFLFNDQMCPYLHQKYLPNTNKELHPSLREKVTNIFNTIDYNDQDIKAGIQTLIANTLAIVKNFDDVYTLLPQQLRSQMPYVDLDIFNIGPLLTDEEISAFQEANKTNLLCLKRMLVTQLLLQESV